MVGCTSVLLGLVAQGKMDGREASLEARIGPLAKVATAASAVSAGAALGEENVDFVEVPRRWVPIGAIESRRGLVGRVAALPLSAGVVLGPGTTREGSGASPLGPGERIATVEAVAPLGILRSGSRIDVLSMRPGGKPRFICRNIEVVSAKPAADSSGSAVESRVQADLRTTVAQAVAIAGASSSGAEVRLLPRGTGERGQ
ncbi:MAG: SAF domain-containing protein [Solirubrobacterales bacterium]|nr:SAF domain-containing protein [Solirubrobacterales bacterium]